ncbi:hypothetical protein [Escherichia fergusonii]|uniref:hypothetical protein n=1 Tax=Escherichia fergusonii TaxID=564 RepID=UPI001CBCD4F0|nr:hypothetical protein [Escherichia fergusonii]MBZ4071115.1 hypothetical protein [Escherichia fergusonii]MBZ4080996.1 hypothetical protein [Escherichia fergusonii]MBZ4083371.1 hypothetical protein [Escherichia fergusonii]MBZ4090063.1 hypothetical protein [Escherichia fergusonii]MBZ4092863.1 hypothetical protein [Escherichia fergusonii]
MTMISSFLRWLSTTLAQSGRGSYACASVLQIVGKVHFVHAGCGVNALSRLHKMASVCRPDKRSASGNFAFVSTRGTLPVDKMASKPERKQKKASTRLAK